MSNIDHYNYHSVGDDWLAAYSSGALTYAQSLLISCQSDMQPGLRRRVERIDEVGGAFLESAEGEALSDSFSDRLARALDKAEKPSVEPVGVEQAEFEWIPNSLHDYFLQTGKSVHWSKVAPGVERMPLSSKGDGRLYLLKVRAGMAMPEHSHSGEEWSLILQGGYHVGDTGYSRGDLHREDENCTHQPVIDDDGHDCISLVYDEGPVKIC